jgi:spermidine synthase
VLFAPPLFLLGMVTPYVVKLYITDTSSGIGKTVGWLYSVSTAGSFVGTVLTGFVLIPNIGVNKIIYLSSLVLVASAVVYFAWFKRKFLAVILVIAPASASFYNPGLPVLIRPDGTRVELLKNEDTAYGQIKVVEYSYGRERIRELLADNIIQGGIEVNTGLSVAGYTYYMEKLGHAYNKNAKNALVIGLGAGLIPSNWQNYYGIKTEVVEISPSVVKTAEKYFAFDNSKVKVHVEDGRYFLKTSADTYDIIALDAFTGDVTPSHLMSIEAFSLIKKRLAPGGVLLINFIGGNTPDDKVVLTSLYGTLSRVFKNIDVYSHENYFNKEPSVVNIVLAVHDAAKLSDEALMTGSLIQPVYAGLKEDVDGMYKRKVAVEKGPMIFTDDYNPADFYDMRLRERWRALTLNSSDRAIIVN